MIIKSESKDFIERSISSVKANFNGASWKYKRINGEYVLTVYL